MTAPRSPINAARAGNPWAAIFALAQLDPETYGQAALEVVRDYPPEDAEGQADLAAALSLTPDEEPDDES